MTEVHDRGDDRRTLGIAAQDRRRTNGRSSASAPGANGGSASDDWPVPKSSMQMRTPSWPSRRSTSIERSRSAMSVVSVISSTSNEGSRPALCERGLDGRHQLVVGELACRQVDRHRERRVGRRLGGPRRGLRARLAQDPRADRARSARSPRRWRGTRRARASPRSGCSQRRSASKPITSDDSNRTTGW